MACFQGLVIVCPRSSFTGPLVVGPDSDSDRARPVNLSRRLQQTNYDCYHNRQLLTSFAVVTVAVASPTARDSIWFRPWRQFSRHLQSCLSFSSPFCLCSRHAYGAKPRNMPMKLLSIEDRWRAGKPCQALLPCQRGSFLYAKNERLRGSPVESCARSMNDVPL